MLSFTALSADEYIIKKCKRVRGIGECPDYGLLELSRHITKTVESGFKTIGPRRGSPVNTAVTLARCGARQPKLAVGVSKIDF